MALPGKLVQIVDPILLPREVDEAPTAIVAAREYNNGNEIQVDVEAQESKFKSMKRPEEVTETSFMSLLST
ncbi:hypothetical protein CMV_028593 [Castanea mollissima]|uniref:Uncharacterized protein n=1 Tax=Castanea mollissima TaxID=60419 RepID=A0A8J4QGZ8_9ROSI|nr:hypothetical protein CMV_028593 [Castanea mollissima]